MKSYYTRRDFLTLSTAAMAGLTMPSLYAKPTAKYVRYSVSSPQGQKMLASYAKGIRAMLKLPADHPQNWFRNAFVHMMDCPHGNWWFYVWHRAYIGYFERTIRELSGDENFTLPFWDWTELAQIPAGMFDDVLTPVANAYAPYTENLARFTSFIKPAMSNYWNTLNSSQRNQQAQRGYKAFDDLWNDVIGYSVADEAGLAGNMAYANTCGSRYLSVDNSRLDPRTRFDVSAFVVSIGLLPTAFYSDENYLSFTSSKTSSHTVQPNGDTKFSVLEGFPHNKVHNCIGGVGAVDPGPYGNMTNFLSPVDPIFFLHHANMDRLWDVWTRKQIQRGSPYLPTGQELQLFSNEPFQFFVDGKGRYVGQRKAGDYLSTEVFDYRYGPGFGEEFIKPPVAAKRQTLQAIQHKASIKNNLASVEIPYALVQQHLDEAELRPLVAEVTIPRPSGLSTQREFDVLINAPADVLQVDADSPYYAGTIAFFGPNMPGMKMSANATFQVPIPRRIQAFHALTAGKSIQLNFRVVAAHTTAPQSHVLKAVTVKGLQAH